MLTAAQQRVQLIALGLAQLDSVPYIHRCPPKLEGTTDESDAGHLSHAFRTPLHVQAGPVPRLHPRLHPGARPAAGRSRLAAPLPRHPAFSPPDGAHPGARRPDPTHAGRRPQHRSPGRAARSAAPTAQRRTNRQILCAKVLVLLSQKAAGQRWGESDKEEDSLSGAGAKMGQPGAEARESRFAGYVEGLASVIGHADRERPLRDYCLGLMLPCERKSVEPIAAVTAPARVA